MFAGKEITSKRFDITDGEIDIKSLRDKSFDIGDNATDMEKALLVISSYCLHPSIVKYSHSRYGAVDMETREYILKSKIEVDDEHNLIGWVANLIDSGGGTGTFSVSVYDGDPEDGGKKHISVDKCISEIANFIENWLEYNQTLDNDYDSGDSRYYRVLQAPDDDLDDDDDLEFFEPSPLGVEAPDDEMLGDDEVE